MKQYTFDDYLDMGNLKFRSCYRDSIYHLLREKDVTKNEDLNTKNNGIFSNMTNIFYISFAIGYNYEKTTPIGKGAENHVNFVSMQNDDIKKIIISLMLKRHQNITPNELWTKVEQYAEYGISILGQYMKEHDYKINLENF